MFLYKKIQLHGCTGSIKLATVIFLEKSGWYTWRFRNAPKFQNPTEAELAQIEKNFQEIGITVHDYLPPPEEFHVFKDAGFFPIDYHGGLSSGVWDEKLFEHWISYRLLGIESYMRNDCFVDVAAAGSPWAKILRDNKGIQSFAIDLVIPDAYSDLPYYRLENATATQFKDASVTGMALHCAYEMFTGEDDIKFIQEATRILKPGGKVVIVPLYMHTHYCAYSTPDYFGKGYSDSAAKEYVRMDCRGIPSSRKYDAAQLKNRIIQEIERCGMAYRLYALRNKNEFGQGIYCHFILEIIR